MNYILGLNTGDEPCQVCNVSPRIFKQTRIEGVLECGRCGLLANVDLDKPPSERIPWPAAPPAWLAVFNEYWQETGDKISAPHVAKGNVELEGRVAKLNAWLNENPDKVAAANISTGAPYMSVTAICFANETDAGPENSWQLIVPAKGVGNAVALPIDASRFAPGTIVTIQTPVLTGAPPENQEGPVSIQ